MFCEDYIELLSAYVDQELDEDQAAVCERHLFRCERCREQYRLMRALHQDLHADPAPLALPLRLDLHLTELADRFATPPLPLALDFNLQALADRFITAPEAASEPKPEPVQDPTPLPSEWQQVKGWLHQHRAQIVLAASLLLSILGGMGVLAYRHGNAPSLTHRDYHVSGLLSHGNELLRLHRAYPADHRNEPAYNAETLAFLFSRHIPYPVVLKTQPFGTATDGRVLPIDDSPTPLVRFDHSTGPISLFTLPTPQALALLGDETPPPVADQCLTPARERCFDDSLGDSLCIQYLGDLTHVWIASMPSDLLRSQISASTDKRTP